MATVFEKRQQQSAAIKKKVRQLHEKGLNLPAISKRVGVSKQRVHQILQEK